MTEPEQGPRIRDSEVDGVQVFWTEDARRVVGAIEFRVGRSDESFPTMGISHLVEHLALFKVGRRPFHVNGFVDPVRTVFLAHGSVEEVTGFFDDVVAALRDLPLDRFADESRILRTEALGRTANLPELLLWYRYGARAFGTVPDSILGELERDAANGLMGHPRDTHEQLLEEMMAVSPEAARDDFAVALGESIMCGQLDDPPGGDGGGRWGPYPIWSADAVIGRRFEAAARRFPWSPRIEQLVVGSDGVSWLNHEGRAATVRIRQLCRRPGRRRIDADPLRGRWVQRQDRRLWLAERRGCYRRHRRRPPSRPVRPLRIHLTRRSRPGGAR